MDLTRVIIGSIVTEKAERLKAAEGVKGSKRRTYTVRVASTATKIDIRNALKMFYDVDVDTVRVMRVQAKTRQLGMGNVMEKRKPYKKALVTLTADSKAFDIAAFDTHSA
jgi:large subunit ribosomal protein L23